eukprot:478646-Prymnesium_polylepis.1
MRPSGRARLAAGPYTFGVASAASGGATVRPTGQGRSRISSTSRFVRRFSGPPKLAKVERRTEFSLRVKRLA